MKEYTWGLAVQGSWSQYLYGDFAFAWTSGEVGEKGYTWFRFPGWKIQTQLVGTLPSASGVHTVRAAFDCLRQDSYETVLEKENAGGVTTPVEYGSRRVFQRMNFTIAPSWQYVNHRGWGLGSTVQLLKARDRSTLMYPFLDNDESTVLRWSVQGRVPLGAFVINAGALVGCKIGEHRHWIDRADPELGVTSEPYRLQDWWDREQEANDATRVEVTLAVRYNFLIGRRVPLFVEAGCDWLHAFGITLLPGCDRQTTYLKLGYNF